MKLFGDETSRRAVLIWAFLASLAVHVIVLLGVTLDLPTYPQSAPLLVEMKPIPKGLVTDAAQAPAKPQRAKKPHRKTVKPPLPGIRRDIAAGDMTSGKVPRAKRPSTGVTASSAASSAVPGTASVTPSMEEIRAAAAETVRGAAASDVVAEGGDAVMPDAEAGAGAGAEVEQDDAAMRGLPAHGRILYRVDRGDREFEIGRAVSEWEIGDDRYVLRLQMETTGLAWLFKSYRIEMESRGWLTATGLRPEYFSIRRNDQTAKERATFDWAQMQVSVADKPAQALDPGAQDLLSFNFHLGFMPDSRVATHLPIVTGKKYAIYPLAVVGDEEIELPMGRVRTLHVRSAGEHTTELWLAYDYFLLPVKIRHVDREGGSFVQVATGIHVDADTP